MIFYLSRGGAGGEEEEEYVLVCFHFPWKAWMSPAAGDPSPQGRGVGSAGVRGCGGTAGPAPLRPRRRLSQQRPPRKAGDRRPSAGSCGRRLPRHLCGNQPLHLVFQMRRGNASSVSRKPRASGLGIGSITPRLSPCSLAAAVGGRRNMGGLWYMKVLCVEHKAGGSGKRGRGG